MIVVTLTDCPPALRGDLSKWLMEINTGVYVGQVSARVRDELWDRIVAHIRHGRATMVFEAANEQKMDFRIHNSSWEIVDFDGLKLIRKPSEQRLWEKRSDENDSADASKADPLPEGFSKAAQQLKLRRIEASKNQKAAVMAIRKGFPHDCTALDLETTGLDPKKDAIIEIAAVRVRGLEVVDSLNLLVQTNQPISEEISRLTGLNSEAIAAEGVPLREALAQLLAFIGDDPLLIHNAAFDLAFLREALTRENLPSLPNRPLDTCALARRLFLRVPDYRLSTLAEHYGVPQPTQHRALPDCQTAIAIYRQMAQTE